MKKKRILVINQTDSFWGGEASLEKAILAMNQKYRVILLTPGGELSKRLEGKIKVISSIGIDRLNRASNSFWIIKFIYMIFISFFEILFYIIRFKPNVIHCFSETAAFYSILPAFLTNKKIVCQLHLVIIKSSFWESVSIFISFFINRYIVISNVVKNRMVEIGHNPNNITVINSGTDINNQFNPDNVIKGLFRKKYKYSNDSYLVALIGSIQPLKGQHIFIDAINIFKDKYNYSKIKFLIIGSPLNEKYFSNIKNLIRLNKLDKVLQIINKIDHSFIPNVLKDIDMFVFTSCIPDAFPRSIIEAMSMQKVIIAAGTGGVNEQIKDGSNGLLYSPYDSNELKEKIKFIYNNPDIGSMIKINARRDAKIFFSDSIYEKNILLFYRNYFN